MNKPVYIVVTPFFPSPTNWRGAYCYDFVKALQREGSFDVRVFVPGNGDAYEYGGVRVRTFKTRQLPSSIFPFLFARCNAASFLRALTLECIDIANVAVCHGHTATFSIYPLAVKKTNPKCLTLLHHHDPQSFGLNTGILHHCWLYNVIQFPILRNYFEQIDCHVFISKMVQKSFILAPDTTWTQYHGYRRQMRGLWFYSPVSIKKSIILHNGVDVSQFRPLKKRDANDTIIIGSIGNFSDWKDQLTLLKAVKILRDRSVADIRVRLIGSGPLLKKCYQYVNENNLEGYVSFEQEIDHSQLPKFYQTLDLFVLPSYFEGFGCVFTEAYACGVPFITCEGQGMDDLIVDTERNLWLIHPQDEENLAEKILYYLQYRPVQHLKENVAIDRLVASFVKDITNNG